jgi:glutathione transport system permease protein
VPEQLTGVPVPAPRTAADPAPGSGDARADRPVIRARHRAQAIVGRFARHRPAVASLALVTILSVLSAVTPLFWRYGPAQITGQYATPPSLQHPFGTDTIGHDLFAQVMSGTATSLKTAVLVAALATGAGTVIGALAGFYGRTADAALMRLTDLFLTVPLLAVLMILSSRVGSLDSDWLWVGLIMAALFWTYLARLVRTTFLSLRQRQFIEAARAIGASDRRIILRHLIPNAAGAIVVNATVMVAAAMLMETAVSFLGLGIQPPQVSIGTLINSGQDDAATMPWLFYFPAGILVASILAVNFVGDGLRDALDPRGRP